MIKIVLPAAVAAIALAAPLCVQAQTVQPVLQPAQPGMTETTTTNVNATIGGPQYTYPGSPGYGYAATAPAYPADMQPQPMQQISPRTTWIPGHYNWDPATSNYVWTSGQYIEAPTMTAQWIPGHWEQTPTAWIWIEGGWH